MIRIARKSQPRASIKTGILLERCPLILILSLAFLTSCSQTREVTPSTASHVIETVPFYPQQEYQCGPASLAGVLNYWGVDISPEEIAAEIYSTSAKGTLDADMILYAERRGLRAHHYKGSLEDVRGNIDSGYPLIVLVDYGFWVYQQNHFMVIVGYEENGIIANSGKDQLKSIPSKDFVRSWEKADFWTLRITPK